MKLIQNISAILLTSLKTCIELYFVTFVIKSCTTNLPTSLVVPSRLSSHLHSRWSLCHRISITLNRLKYQLNHRRILLTKNQTYLLHQIATINAFRLFPKIAMKGSSKLTGSLGENIGMIGIKYLMQLVNMNTKKTINPKHQHTAKRKWQKLYQVSHLDC